MKKKLTLDGTWRLCLAQWKCVTEQIEAGSLMDAVVLKRKWLRKNGYSRTNIAFGCFFCEYNNQNGGNSEGDDCSSCPGKMISKSFDCERRPTYSWLYKPLKFHAKLLYLNEKRLNA